KPTCPRASTRLPRTPTGDGDQLPFASPKIGQTPCAFARDQSFEPEFDERSLFRHARQSSGTREELVIDVQGCSHMHQYAPTTRQWNAAKPGHSPATHQRRFVRESLHTCSTLQTAK